MFENDDFKGENTYESPTNHNELDIDLEHKESTPRPENKIIEQNSFNLEYCFDIVLKEAIKEEKLIKQIFYTMLSAYTNNPINLAINAPSGEGKSHALTKVIDLFPREDVLSIADMSNKAIFHKNGYLAVRNEEGQYTSVENILEKLRDEIETKKLELKSLDVSVLLSKRKEISELQQRIKEIQKNAVKVIDLSHKILVFLDTPRQEIFEALMTLLSHDKYEVEYQYVDSSNKSGLKTKTNVLKGWPAVIFAQAIDYTKHTRYQEIQRRFIVTNPRMDVEKYRGAVDLIIEKNCIPDFVYQKRVVSDFDKEIAGEILSSIKEDLLYLSNSTKPGKNNIVIPFSHFIKQIISKNISSQDMTFANRLMNYIVLMTYINYKNRPFIEIYRDILDFDRIPLALYEDLAESLNLLNNSSGGVRPYILEWYENIFMKLYDSKLKPDSKITYDRGEMSEQRIGLTTQELIEKTKEGTNKSYTTKAILSEFIYPLSNLGYIDSIPSEIDRRAKLYFPVVDLSEKYSNLFLLSQKNNLLYLKDSNDIKYSNIIDKKHIISYIDMILKYYSGNGDLVTIKETIGGKDRVPEEIVNKYYSDDAIDRIQKDRSNSTEKVDNNNNNYEIKTQLSEEYLIEAEINNKLQINDQKYTNYDITNEQSSNNLFLTKEKNKLIYSCYHGCNFQTELEEEYQKHYVIVHPNKPAYPSSADIKKYNLQPQVKPWE